MYVSTTAVIDSPRSPHDVPTIRVEGLRVVILTGGNGGLTLILASTIGKSGQAAWLRALAARATAVADQIDPDGADAR